MKDVSAMIENLRSMADAIEATAMNIKSLSMASPLEPLIEVAVDILLKLGNVLSEEFRAIPTPNPELVFSERWQDSKGDPLQIKYLKTPPIMGPDPTTAFMCRKLAQYLIKLKESILVDFHGQHWITHEDSIKEIQKSFLNSLKQHFADISRTVTAKREKLHQVALRQQGSRKKAKQLPTSREYQEGVKKYASSRRRYR